MEGPRFESGLWKNAGATCCWGGVNRYSALESEERNSRIKRAYREERAYKLDAEHDHEFLAVT
jgi:hypothetical protein